MDTSIADFSDFANVNFGSFPDEVKTNASYSHSSHSAASSSRGSTFVRANRPPVSRLSDVFNVVDGAKKPRGLRLTLRSKTDAELDADIARMREEAVKIVTGSEAVPISDNRKNAKCEDRLECSRIWHGQCVGNHNTANGLLIYLLGFIYTVEEVEMSKQAPKADAFSIEENDADLIGSYLHVPHPEQDFRIKTKPRTNITQDNLRKLYREGIPDFFAGKDKCTMQRIGAHETDKRIHKTDKDTWCRAPYCQRSLLAAKLVTVRSVPGRGQRTFNERRPACNRFHTYISSVLTNVIRSVLECEKVEVPREEMVDVDAADAESTPVKERAPRTAPPAPRKNKTAAPVIRHNAFEKLLDDAASPKEKISPRTRNMEEPIDTAIATYGEAMQSSDPRLQELETKLRDFETKNRDALKYNAGMRDRRDKMVQQIARQRSLTAPTVPTKAKGDSFDD